ncbi:hypothetical protein AB0D08_24615 [Kitasatospora sp. NPDC048540]|uniref:hypothetical protein n=1 Tax=unclassified Kitasatospora TaxID=2633591 RepID=UPI00068AF1B2|nr:hypothetical protein [Kitasatospora sp. MBT63]
MNLDFSAEPLFSWYVVLLLVSGLALIGIAAAGLGQSAGMRALNGLFGAGFLGYGVYLGFIFEGGDYIIFFKVFILPVVLIAAAVKNFTERSNRAQAPAPVQPPADAAN